MICGGDKGSIAAVAVAAPGQETRTVTIPEGREAKVAAKWADAFRVRYDVPVVVETGIHFDSVTADQVDMIVEGLDELLESFILTEH